MATLEELMQQGNLARPGGFLSQSNSNIARTSRPEPPAGPANSFGGNGAMRMTATTRTPSTGRQRAATDPLATVNRALEIYQQKPVQNSRGAAESSANSQIAESLRLGLIEQKRLRERTREPMGPVERRALHRDMQINQTSIDSLLGGVGGIREGQVETRGQNVEAATTLTDRQLAEDGAYDRRLLGVDEAMIRGEFGLAEQGLRNQGALQVKQTMDPIDAARLERIDQLEASFADADPSTRSKLGYGIINNLSSGADLSLGGPEELVEVETVDGVRFVPKSIAGQAGAYQTYRDNPAAFGVTPELTERYAEQIATQGWGQQEIMQAEQTRREFEQRRDERQQALEEQRRKKAREDVMNRLLSRQTVGGI